MTSKDEILSIAKQNPGWDSGEIARALCCNSAHVRATMRRVGMVRRPSAQHRIRKPKHRPETVAYLGEFAKDVGMTIQEMARWARSRGISATPPKRESERHLGSFAQAIGMTSAHMDEWANEQSRQYA